MGGVATTGVPSLTVATGLGDNSICYSSDGINWTGIPKSTHDFGVNGYVYGNGVAWNGTRFVAVGYGDNSICYSSDGINWTGIPSSANEFGVDGSGLSVAWNGTRFVAVGQGDNSICYSSDGINWTGILNSANQFGVDGQGTGVAWNGTRFVAVGGRGINSVCYSSDGINWTGIPMSANNFGVGGSGYGVAWNGTRFVAVGSGANSICYSSDGINWTGIPASTKQFGVSGTGYGVASKSYVGDYPWKELPALAPLAHPILDLDSTTFTVTVTDEGYDAVTEQGVCWSTVSNPTTDCNHQVGSTVNITSYINRSTVYHARAYAKNSAGTAYSNDVEFLTFPTPVLTVAVGDGANSICYSSDGINWTGIPKSANNFGVGGSGYGVAWNGTCLLYTSPSPRD